LTDPFNPESRFYWPLVAALGVALLANIVWYYWPTPGARGRRAGEREPPAPAETGLRPWIVWTNIITLIFVSVLLIAKTPAWTIALAFALDLAALLYIYLYWLPPHEAAWLRERRRQRYIPKPERRKRRRR